MELTIKTIKAGIHLGVEPSKDLKKALDFIEILNPLFFTVSIDTTEETMNCITIYVKETNGNTQFNFRFLDSECSIANFIFGEHLSGFTYVESENQYSFEDCLDDVKTILERYIEIKNKYRINLDNLHDVVHQTVDRVNN